MSVGGTDHRIPQCNRLTLFGSAVSVVEFPPAAQVPLLDASEVSRQEKFFHSLQTQFLSCIAASFEITARRPLSLLRATPLFLEENVAVRFLLGERYFRKLSVFRRSLILKLLILRPEDCTCDKTVFVPRPFW